MTQSNNSPSLRDNLDTLSNLIFLAMQHSVEAGERDRYLGMASEVIQEMHCHVDCPIHSTEDRGAMVSEVMTSKFPPRSAPG
jgi:hypothetical protein